MIAPRPAAHSTTLIDNDRTVTTEWRFASGAETGWHTHTLDYVVVPVTSGRLLIEFADGSEVRSELTAGAPYFRRAGVHHNVVNDNEHEFVFIEVELRP